jgi:opacity protein-like surface antigen
MKKLIIVAVLLFLVGVSVAFAKDSGIELYLNGGASIPGTSPSGFVDKFLTGAAAGCGVGYRVNSWLTPMVYCDWYYLRGIGASQNKLATTPSLDLKATLPINSPVRPYLVVGCGWSQLCEGTVITNCNTATGIVGLGLDYSVLKSLSIFVEGDYVAISPKWYQYPVAVAPIKVGICWKI